MIGFTEITNINNEIEKPYAHINIQEGDTILELNNQEIDCIKTLQSVVNNSMRKQYRNEICTQSEKY